MKKHYKKGGIKVNDSDPTLYDREGNPVYNYRTKPKMGPAAIPPISVFPDMIPTATPVPIPVPKVRRPKSDVEFERLRDKMGKEYFAPKPVPGYTAHQWMNLVNQLPDDFSGIPVIKGDPYRELYATTSVNPNDWYPTMGKGGKVQPYYTENPKDPRIQAYKDSLSSYNKYQPLMKRLNDYINLRDLDLILSTDNTLEVAKEAGKNKNASKWYANYPDGNKREYPFGWFEKPKQKVILGSLIQPIPTRGINIDDSFTPQMSGQLPVPQLQKKGSHYEQYQAGANRLPTLVPEYAPGGQYGMSSAMYPGYMGYPNDWYPTMGKGGKVQPLYVDSPSDPRYRAYQDSLDLYNQGEKMRTVFINSGQYYPNPEHEKIKINKTEVGYLHPFGSVAGDKGYKYVEDSGPQYKVRYNKNIQPQENLIFTHKKSDVPTRKAARELINKQGTMGDVSWMGHGVQIYKEPVQPVIVGQPLSPIDPIGFKLNDDLAGPQLPSPRSVPQIKPKGYHYEQYQSGPNRLPTLVPEYAPGGEYGMSSAAYPGYLGYPTNEFPDNKVEPYQQPGQQSRTNWQGMANMGADMANATMGVTNAAIGVVNWFSEQKKKKEQEQRMREQGMTDNAFANTVQTSTGNRGDYVTTGSGYGMFRPDQMNLNSPQGMYGQPFYPSMAEGGPVDLNQTQFDVPNTDALLASSMPELPAMASGPAMAPTSDNLRDMIAMKESSGDYMALPKKKDGTLASSAVGKYQFLWDQHKPWITQVTGVKSKEEFRRNPEAQEMAFDYWDATTLTPHALKIKSMIPNPNISLDQIKAKIHFAGPKGALDFYTKGKETVDAFGTRTSTYEIGGEVEMTTEQLAQFLAEGGEVEYL